MAPLKESLASALVLFSGWKFRSPLYDPMCGSGTLLIEAAMIARNIAPWLQREFDYLYFPWYDLPCHDKAVKEAKTKIFEKSYEIYWNDIDSRVLEFAMDNAHRAGVGDTIRFSEGDFRDVSFQKNAHLVTNPPYGKRMWDADIDGLYNDLENIFLTNELTGWVITTVENFPKNETGWTKKNLMNGSEKCEFWRKIS
jgi:putative N6-adenine-specific DNA methylase